jgi:hypothetical protein
MGVWLPWHCHLGRSLSTLEIPAWNPYTMAGSPFAADPQSGWMNLPVMLLYGFLACHVAVRWFLVLQPVLAGLGAYAFLRSEDVSRPAATVSGVVLSLGLSGSFLVASFPFAGTIAWMCLTLAAAARLVRTTAPKARALWILLTAFAWGQLAATHLSNGLVTGTMALVAYLAARAVADHRSGRRRLARSSATVGVLVLAMAALNLAILVPRLALLPRTSISRGYETLEGLSASLAGTEPRDVIPGSASSVDWPLKLAESPGAYLGAAALALAFAALFSRRLRPVAVAMAAFGFISYLLGLRPVAVALEPALGGTLLEDVFLHRPWRFAVALLPAVAIMAGLGVEAWREERSWARRATMLAPGAVLWGVLPLALGAPPARLGLLMAGAAMGAGAFIAGWLRPGLLWSLPIALTFELGVNAVVGQTGDPVRPKEFGVQTLPFGMEAFRAPMVPAADYLEPGRIGRTLLAEGGGRYHVSGGYVYMLKPEQWPALADQRSVLFGIEESQGYNPTQSFRYWLFLRTLNRTPIKYNAAVLVDPSPAVLDLLQVEWLVSRRLPGDPEWIPVVNEGDWVLFRRPTVPRATLFTGWRVVGSEEASLATVTAPTFDSTTQLVLGSDPGRTPAATTSVRPATFRWTSTTRAEVEVQAGTGGLLLVRNAWDPNWRATVDGREAPVLVADHVLQAVPVPAGRHTIVLRYVDASIGYGLLGTGIAIIVAAAIVAWLWRRAPSADRDGQAAGTVSATTQAR